LPNTETNIAGPHILLLFTAITKNITILIIKGQFNENQNSLAHTFTSSILPKNKSSINSVKKTGCFKIFVSGTKKRAIFGNFLNFFYQKYKGKC
jgi:hypothetical protein